ncbi:hypothetical protein AB0L86_27855 [Micromonospora musae]|uniref:hypothetical protein n=1 Tax=Micromonospora musae TaxID=1894970 RepID=UPI0034356F66
MARLVSSLKGVSARRYDRSSATSCLTTTWQANCGRVSFFADSAGRAPLSAVKQYIGASEPSRVRHCSGLGSPPSADRHPRPKGRNTGPRSGSRGPPQHLPGVPSPPCTPPTADARGSDPTAPIR